MVHLAPMSRCIGVLRAAVAGQGRSELCDARFDLHDAHPAARLLIVGQHEVVRGRSPDAELRRVCGHHPLREEPLTVYEPDAKNGLGALVKVDGWFRDRLRNRSAPDALKPTASVADRASLKRRHRWHVERAKSGENSARRATRAA